MIGYRPWLGSAGAASVPVVFAGSRLGLRHLGRSELLRVAAARAWPLLVASLNSLPAVEM